MKIEQLVTFAILMETGEGITTKAPDYIKEKFSLCEQCQEDWQLQTLLDWNNQAKLQRWQEIWGRKLIPLEEQE